ncbi:MAG: UDP-N-acetylglucosamine 1-carboxyvinyltransferase [Eubacteriales bacterium]|nr:UDP-N-acetylglucosamine 1-carboxyvinyltransferase [Eubacteriales bacterium]
MSKLLIEGSRKLRGAVKVQGAKNSTLPILAATVVTEGENVIHNCPCLTDIDVSIRILRYLGCSASRHGHTLLVNTDNMTDCHIPNSLMREMRSSIVFLGGILARFKKARLSFPGGCELGPRPIDLHLDALKKLGAVITEHHGEIYCKAPKGLVGGTVALAFPSVGATENIMIAACLAKGTTIINNAAREPEISDLADYLNKCGAEIYGAGEGTVVIEGKEKLHGVAHTVIPDRIVAATLMSAAAITGSEIYLEDIMSTHLSAVIPVFEEAGCNISVKEGTMKFSSPERIKGLKLIRTNPYPGFPTDAQAPLMALSTVSRGITVFVETIFENRYKHIGEFLRMGANIKAEGRVAVVEGVPELYGTSVEAMDLRGSAALVVAGLGAQGTTEIDTTKYLERGYEDLDVVLSSLNASVKKI